MRYGIANGGSTCYLSAALQLLGTTESFLIPFLRDKSPSNSLNAALYMCLETLRRGPQSAPYQLQQLLGFPNFQQHDATEALETILNKVQESLPKHLISRFDAYTAVKTRSITVCHNCQKQQMKDGDKAISKVTERVLRLPFPLDTSLDRMVNDISLTVSNEPGTCDGCKQSGGLVQASSVWPPTYLFIVVPRVTMRGKDTTPVAYSETLTFPKRRGQSHQLAYELRGLIVHRGSSFDSGHYIAFVKHDNQWWFADDDMVRPVQQFPYEFNSVTTLLYEVQGYID